MRVHNDIGTQTGGCERHITLVQDHTARTLLPGTGCELVPDLGDTLRDHAHLDERVAVRVLILPHPVNACRLSVLVGGREVAVGVSVRVASQIHNLADHYIVLLDDGMLHWHAVLLDSGIRGVLVASRALLLRLGEPLFPTARDVAVLLVLIDGVVEPAHEPAVQRTAIEDHRILLVVA